MKIEDQCFVAIQYSLRLDSGEEVDKSDPGNPLGFVFNSGQVIPGLEMELRGKKLGYKTQFVVEPENGYGEPQGQLVRTLPRTDFPSDVDLKSGMTFQAEGPHGTIPFIIKSVSDNSVTIDLNHPLCGQRLHFDVEVVEVRTPSEEELQHLGCSCHQGENSCGGCH